MKILHEINAEMGMQDPAAEESDEDRLDTIERFKEMLKIPIQMKKMVNGE